MQEGDNIMKQALVYETLELMQKRFKFLVGARWEDTGEITKAIEEQDIIRTNLTKRLKGDDSIKITRRIRDSRCKY